MKLKNPPAQKQQFLSRAESAVHVLNMISLFSLLPQAALLAP